MGFQNAEIHSVFAIPRWTSTEIDVQLHAFGLHESCAEVFLSGLVD
jgi:hypothetical protein